MGSSASTPIQILALSLLSVVTIEATYGGGSPSFYEMFVALDPTVTQGIGTLTLTRTGDLFGTFTSSLPVAFELTFTGTSPGDPQAMTIHGSNTFMNTSSNPGIWAVPAPSTSSLLFHGVYRSPSAEEIAMLSTGSADGSCRNEWVGRLGSAPHRDVGPEGRSDAKDPGISGSGEPAGDIRGRIGPRA